MGATERIVEIVSYLAVDQKSHGLTEIWRQLGISKTTAHRILSALESLQWVVRDSETRKYRLGYAVLEIGLSTLSHLDIRSTSLPYLSQLHDTTNETAMLSLRVGLERVYIEQIESNSELRMIAELGKRYPLWCGAQGKAILAYMGENEVEVVIDKMIKSGFRVFASGERVNIERLRQDLEEIRKQGFAMSFGERVTGSAAVASAIFGRDGRVIGAISVQGPLNRFSVDVAKHYGTLVRNAADAINRELSLVRKEARIGN